MIYPPLKSDFHLPVLQVETEAGRTVALDTLIHTKNPAGMTLLIPGFTHCHGTCPLQIQAYKKLLQGESHQSISVLFFSFNPEDTAEGLREFHAEQGAPAGWTFLRADGTTTQQLLDSLQFTTMKVGENFDHPVQAFAFSSDGTWLGSLYGLDVTEKEVEQMQHKAEMQVTSPVLYTILSRVKNPNVLAVYGGAGCVISLLVIFYFLFFSKRRQAPSS